MVILKAYNSAGKTGQCDERCYDARTKRCRCCCDGWNHGVGLNKAIENAAEIVRLAKGGESPEPLEQVTFERPHKQLRLLV